MKRKLLLAMLCFAAASVYHAHGQTDVTSLYITNAGFDACTAESSDVAAKTIKNYSSSGWTNANTGSYTTIAVTAYGGGKKVGGSTTPSTKKDGTVSGNTLGIIAGWADEVKIQSGDITYPAGYYTLTVDHYLSSSTTNYGSSSSRFGFVTSSTSYLVSSTAFTASTWTTEKVTFTLTESTTGKIQIGLKGNNNTGSGSPAVFYDDVTLTYIPFATTEDYSNLNSAISTVEGKAWGFDEGEYAPYNYVEVLEALAAAKAIDQTANNLQTTVQALTSTLNGATWTANTEEVNVIWDPSFEYNYSTSGNVQPIAWTGTSGHNNATDVRWMWNVSSNSGLAATSSSKALFTKFGAYYGQQTGYTLPLNASTYYTISFKYGGWYDCKKNGYVTMTDPASESLTLLPSKDLPLDAVDGHTNKDSWKKYSGIFKTNDAGDYVLGLLHSGGNIQSQYAYGDFILKATTVDEAIAYYNTVKTAAESDYNADANGGNEKTALRAALDASVPGTIAEIMEAAANLKTKHDTYVSAKPAYAKFYLEKTRALAIGVAEADITVIPTLSNEVTNALNALYVLEDAAATANYTIDATDIFGAWTEQNTGSTSGQHWSGDSSISYIDKNSSDGFTMSVTNTVILPAGKYVFKAAARAAAGGVWDDALTMQVTDQPNAIFNPNGNTGKGIDTSGAANYGEGTFANENNGRGWEWRFIPFTVTDEDVAQNKSIMMKVEAIVKGGNWASFSDITLLTTTDNIEICRQMYEASKTTATSARDNATYANAVNGPEWTALNNAITEAVPDPATVVWYQEQKNELDAATVAFTGMDMTEYNRLAAAKAYTDLTKITNNIGIGVFQYNATTNDNLFSEYATAKNAVNGYIVSETSTAAEIQALVDALDDAIDAYKNQALNAPDASKRYKLTLANKGALTFKTSSTEGGYGMPFMDAADYKAQTFTLTPVVGEANTYTLSFEDFEGNTRYVCTRAQYGSGGTGTAGIRTFANDNEKTALKISIQAAESDNVFYMLNTERNNAKLGAQNNGDFYTVTDNSDWSIEEASQASLTVSAKAGKFGTTIIPFTPDVTTGFEGIKFYSITSADDAIELEEVSAPAANVPYLIKNSGSDNFTKNLEGWGTAVADSYKDNNNCLTGVYTTVTIPASAGNTINYVLQTQNGVQKFYKVDSDFTATAYKAYLTVTGGTGAKSLGFNIDEGQATGIDNIVNILNADDAVIYNAAGARQNGLQKGLNIIRTKDGKVQKVLVK